MEMLSELKEQSSRPAWACELKSKTVRNIHGIISSRPAWACELKLKRYGVVMTEVKSRPAWACELKCRQKMDKGQIDVVTPRVGV